MKAIILASRIYKKNIYHKLPYSKPLEGTESTLNSLQKSDLQNHYNTFYKPNNLIIAFVGDIDEARAVQLVEEKFGSFTGEFVNNTKLQKMNILTLKRKFT
jgi:zinc protease